jgi:hypothetical protein
MGVVLNLSPSAPLPNASQLKAAITTQKYPAPFPFLSSAFVLPVDFGDALTSVQIYPILQRAFLSRLFMLALLGMSWLHLRCCMTPFRNKSERLNRLPFKLVVVVLA